MDIRYTADIFNADKGIYLTLKGNDLQGLYNYLLYKNRELLTTYNKHYKDFSELMTDILYGTAQQDKEHQFINKELENKINDIYTFKSVIKDCTTSDQELLRGILLDKLKALAPLLPDNILDFVFISLDKQKTALMYDSKDYGLEEDELFDD